MKRWLNKSIRFGRFMQTNRPLFRMAGLYEGAVQMRKRALSGKKTQAFRWLAVRPLVLLSVCFAVGVVIAHAAPSGMWVVWAGAAALVSGGIIVLRERALAFSLAMLLGALWMNLFMIKPDVSAAENVLLTGRVDSEVTQGERSWRVRLSDVCLDGEECRSKVMLYFYSEPPELAYGARISVQVNTWLPAEHADSGGYDYAAWLWRQRAALGATARSKSEVIVEAPTSFSLIGWSLDMRSRLTSVIKRIFPEDCAGFAAALITGDKSSLPEELKESYRRAGVSHLLALSGLHVGALFLCLEYVLRRAHVQRHLAFGLSLGLMAVYTLVVGCPASIMRAGLMYALARAFFWAGRATA